jgi:acetyltransferase-like isoleucine patch superfamily enzyme
MVRRALARLIEFAKPIEIGSDAWIGGGAVKCLAMKNDSRSMVEAGSVVTRDIPDNVFPAGTSCRVEPFVSPCDGNEWRVLGMITQPEP